MPEDIRKILDEYKEETKRHFDVVAERLEDKIEIVSEQVATNTEQITALQEQVAANTEQITLLQEQVAVNTKQITALQQDMSKVKDDIGIIKLDIEFIKNELKQKVSRDEFVALERRVSMLEAKQK